LNESFTPSQNVDESWINAWKCANILVIDAPLFPGDSQERLNFAKSLLEGYFDFQFGQQWKILDEDDIINWIFDSNKSRGCNLYADDNTYGYGTNNDNNNNVEVKV
jgi:hypothetical protein